MRIVVEMVEERKKRRDERRDYIPARARARAAASSDALRVTPAAMQCERRVVFHREQKRQELLHMLSQATVHARKVMVMHIITSLSRRYAKQSIRNGTCATSLLARPTGQESLKTHHELHVTRYQVATTILIML